MLGVEYRLKRVTCLRMIRLGLEVHLGWWVIKASPFQLAPMIDRRMRAVVQSPCVGLCVWTGFEVEADVNIQNEGLLKDVNKK